ncbi:MAG: hypothetical protein HYR96_01305 [Deltaproteobacteria bacterium]|nr:hypothetical protein [Deltaproteobacteria bacterium]MBI3294355.1 hypothetical protein [Deltaproteobacteria bacterium]
MSLARLRLARADERGSRLKSAARSYAKLALGLARVHAWRSRALIARAIRLAPDAPKLYAIEAVVWFHLKEVPSALSSVDQFVALIEHRANRKTYETFFRVLTEEIPALHPHLKKRRGAVPSAEEEKTLSEMITEVADHLEINLGGTDDSKFFAGSEKFLAALGEGHDQLRIDLAVAFLVMGFYELALKAITPVYSRRAVKMSLVGEILFEANRGLEAFEHVSAWQRLLLQGNELVECRYQLLRVCVKLRQWDAALKHSSWLKRNAPTYRNAHELIIAADRHTQRSA